MLTPDVSQLDRRIAQEAATLARRGMQVDIFPTSDSGLEFDGKLASGVRLMTNQFPVRSARRALRLARTWKQKVGRVLPVVHKVVEVARYRFTDSVSRLTDANISHLSGLQPYELIFAHDIPVAPLAARLKALWGASLICDLHEMYAEQDEFFSTARAKAYWRSVESEAMSSADGVICVNSAVADYIEGAWRPAGPIVVLLNAVPYSSPAGLVGQTIRDIYPIAADQRVMLFVGSLRPSKNLETLIEGFHRAGLDEWALAILGEGPLLGRLSELAEGGARRDAIYIGKRVAQQDLISVASSANVGLLPYLGKGLNHLNATPNKLFEYIAARLPVASSKLPMVEKLIHDQQNGGFVDYATPAGTAAGLGRFVGQVLPSITASHLESAAKAVSWEAEEPRLRWLVARVLEQRKTASTGTR